MFLKALKWHFLDTFNVGDKVNICLWLAPPVFMVWAHVFCVKLCPDPVHPYSQWEQRSMKDTQHTLFNDRCLTDRIPKPSLLILLCTKIHTQMYNKQAAAPCQSDLTLWDWRTLETKNIGMFSTAGLCRGLVFIYLVKFELCTHFNI